MVNLLSSDWLPPANMIFKQQVITATVSNRWMVGCTDTQMDAWMIVWVNKCDEPSIRNLLHTLQVFVLSFEDFELLQRFLIRILCFEEFSAEGARLFLYTIQFSLSFLIFLLPLRKNL